MPKFINQRGRKTVTPENEIRSLVRQVLQTVGFEVNEEVVIADILRADIVARRGDRTLLVECKAFDPNRTLTPDSVAQVVDYATRYSDTHQGVSVQPILLVGCTVPDTVNGLAQETGVKIARISDSTFDAVSLALTNAITG